MLLQEHLLQQVIAPEEGHHREATAIGAARPNIGQISAGGTLSIPRINAPIVRREGYCSTTLGTSVGITLSQTGNLHQQLKDLKG